MSPPQLPAFEQLKRRWQKERALRLLRPLSFVLAGVLAACFVSLCFGPATYSWILGVGVAAVGIWCVAALMIFVTLRREPPVSALAKRADAILSLSDDLLSLSEMTASEGWQSIGWQRTMERIGSQDITSRWPLSLSRVSKGMLAVCVLLSLAVGGLGWWRYHQESLRLMALAAASQERLEQAEELLSDWEQFTEIAEDPALKQVFAEAAQLREALRNPDPTQAMLELHRVEQKMSAMVASLESQSMAPQSANIAESLESFEGLSALAAAIRNQDFSRAAEEAGKVSDSLSKNPDGNSALNRGDATAESLSQEAQTASQRGASDLSNALQQFSKNAGQRRSSVPNKELRKSVNQMKNLLAQESMCQGSCNAAKFGMQQIAALRRCLQEGRKESPFASLCNSPTGQACSGKKPGTASGGDPIGEQTTLVDPAVSAQASVQMGEGESELRTTSASSGGGAVSQTAQPVAFSDYVELSQKAVEDENLPLAHRRVIRRYFERIRPTSQSANP